MPSSLPGFHVIAYEAVDELTCITSGDLHHPETESQKSYKLRLNFTLIRRTI
jgi:hypothetical protein